MATSPGFLYSCVTKRKYTLCEAYTTSSINFTSSITEITKTSISNASSDRISKKSINNIHFHIYNSKGFLFIVATELEGIGDRAADFLRAIQTRFCALRLDKSSVVENGQLSKLCLNSNFKTELSTILNQYNTNKKIWATQQSMQSLNQIRSQVDEVTEIMRNNIDTVLDRGEALEDMICRADDLQATSNVFQQQTTQIHRNIYWHNMKWKIILFCLLFLIFGLIIGAIVKKFHHGDEPDPTAGSNGN